MSRFNTDREILDCAALLILIIFILVCVFGCSSRVSSTDNHHRLPEVNCSMIMYDNHMEKLCCQQQTCWIAQ